jgi:hypothetical protein
VLDRRIEGVVAFDLGAENVEPQSGAVELSDPRPAFDFEQESDEVVSSEPRLLEDLAGLAGRSCCSAKRSAANSASAKPIRT